MTTATKKTPARNATSAAGNKLNESKLTLQQKMDSARKAATTGKGKGANKSAGKYRVVLHRGGDVIATLDKVNGGKDGYKFSDDSKYKGLSFAKTPCGWSVRDGKDTAEIVGLGFGHIVAAVMADRDAK